MTSTDSGTDVLLVGATGPGERGSPGNWRAEPASPRAGCGGQTLMAGSHCSSQRLAVGFPRTTLADGHDEPRTVLRRVVNQLTAQAFVLLPVLLAGRQLALSTSRGRRPATTQEPS
jgi:hypothetical protein